MELHSNHLFAVQLIIEKALKSKITLPSCLKTHENRLIDEMMKTKSVLITALLVSQISFFTTNLNASFHLDKNDIMKYVRNVEKIY